MLDSLFKITCVSGRPMSRVKILPRTVWLNCCFESDERCEYV